MCSSVVSSSLSLHPKYPFLNNNPFKFGLTANTFLMRRRNASPFYITSLIAKENPTREFSWISWDEVATDGYNGWDVNQFQFPKKSVIENGFLRFLAFGIGASVVGLLAYYSFSRKGFVYGVRIPSHVLHGFRIPFLTSKNDITNEEERFDGTLGNADVVEGYVDRELGEITVTETSPNTVKEQKSERIIVPFIVDSVQQEALFALKKLKIIDDDARADELCTRQEYGRWLVRASSRLERSRVHQIIPFTALNGSRIIAFDDVSIQDPDFEFIQSLAESGIIESKLSNNCNSDMNGLDDEAAVNFFPERYISREDLIVWKAKTEYEVIPRISEEVSRKNIGFLDVKEISSDALMDLFLDLLANENSIFRGVFGQSNRLQPNKPCTKAQAAVALTCGRLSEFILAEISRLEAESVSRRLEIKEAISELLERGEIKQFWERRIEEEVSRGIAIERDYHTSVTSLELEKNLQETSLLEMLKQQAALDCQKQLLSSLNSEVADMSERFSSESRKHVDEQRAVHDMRHELESQHEEVLDAKSVLEAEAEALRILRSWTEDEARKCQARAKVLEEAGRRWKWDN